MANTVNAAGRLDRLPVSRFHWKILGLIAGGAFLVAFDIYLANGSVASMVKVSPPSIEARDTIFTVPLARRTAVPVLVPGTGGRVVNPAVRSRTRATYAADDAASAPVTADTTAGEACARFGSSSAHKVSDGST